MPALKLISIGTKFDRLTVVSAPVRTKNRVFYQCLCICGTEKPINGVELRGGQRSCGCLRDDIGNHRTHGYAKTPIYICWCNMIARCENKNSTQYVRYGARGIKVCDRWRQSFEAFLEDMGFPPDGYEIDRIDNDLGYEPKNCRWATKSQQARNTSMTTKITFRGETRPLSDWCETFGLKTNTFRSRLRYGWDLERAFLTPLHRNQP